MPGGKWRLEKTRERLLSRVKAQPDGCWEWTGFITPQGYGATSYYGRRGMLAHRALYSELVGAIPDSLTLDHLCHTADESCPGAEGCPHRRCVNPEHLEPVSAVENIQRGSMNRRTSCPKGHPYSEENTLVSNGRRYCRTCQRAHADRNSAKRSAARARRAGVAT